jgi:hypothetical protein
MSSLACSENGEGKFTELRLLINRPYHAASHHIALKETTQREREREKKKERKKGGCSVMLQAKRLHTFSTGLHVKRWQPGSPFSHAPEHLTD